MSDTTDGPEDAETTETPVTPETSDASAAERKPRPSTSAASRARRIGGGTVPAAPRPAPGDAPAAAEEPTVNLGKRFGRSAKGADKPAGKAADKTADKTAGKAPDGAADKSAGKAATSAVGAKPPVAPLKPARPAVSVPAWLAWAPAIAFFLVAAVFLALLLVNRIGGDDTSTTSSEERQTVLAAAKQCVAATNTYKYTNIDKYEAAGVKCTTGQYSKQYSNAMNTLIKKNAPTQKFTQIAQVSNAGIESVTKSGKQWSVLIYGQLNITNAALGKSGRVDPFGLVATMAQDNGKWVIARIRLLSSAS